MLLRLRGEGRAVVNRPTTLLDVLEHLIFDLPHVHRVRKQPRLLAERVLLAREVQRAALLWSPTGFALLGAVLSSKSVPKSTESNTGVAIVRLAL